MEEPPSTTPCLGLLLWVRPVYGDDAPESWARLARKTVTTTKGWSEAYGLFLEGEAPMVLSYSTSPAYHMIAEDEDRYQAAGFAGSLHAGRGGGDDEVDRRPGAGAAVPALHADARLPVGYPDGAVEVPGDRPTGEPAARLRPAGRSDRKSTRLNSSH